MAGLRELEPQEIQQRMRSLFRYGQVGLCVNSVTHDMNNFLGAILAYAELVDMSEDLGAESRRMLHEIAEGVRRCTSLLSNLTVVARPEKPSVVVIDLGKLVGQVIDLRGHDLRYRRIQLDQDIQPDLPSFAVDLPQLQLALTYLLTNACEAVLEEPVKSIRVRVYSESDTFTITFWDSGPPIDPHRAARMFDPFVTSKEGHHLGLGLSTARDIALLHDGTLDYDPERGMILTLPRKNRFSEESS